MMPNTVLLESKVTCLANRQEESREYYDQYLSQNADPEVAAAFTYLKDSFFVQEVELARTLGEAADLTIITDAEPLRVRIEFDPEKSKYAVQLTMGRYPTSPVNQALKTKDAAAALTVVAAFLHESQLITKAAVTPNRATQEFELSTNHPINALHIALFLAFTLKLDNEGIKPNLGFVFDEERYQLFINHMSDLKQPGKFMDLINEQGQRGATQGTVHDLFNLMRPDPWRGRDATPAKFN